MHAYEDPTVLLLPSRSGMCRPPASNAHLVYMRWCHNIKGNILTVVIVPKYGVLEQGDT